MFSFFLFYYEDGYFNITDAKYHCFVVLSFFYLIACMICLTFSLFFNPLFINSLKNQIKCLSLSDWAMLLLLLSHIITTLSSDYQAASFSGDGGRFMGLCFSIIACGVYFFVSRLLIHRSYLLQVFLFCALLTAVLGIGNACGWDPLHCFESLKPQDMHRFLATIGNTTFFAHLYCLTLPLVISLFAHTHHHKLRLYYGVWIFCAFCAVFVSSIDGAYLGMTAMLLCFFWQYSNSYERLKLFLYVCLLALLGLKLLCLGSYIFDSFVFDGISNWLVHSVYTWIILGVVMIAVLLLKQCAKREVKISFHNIRRYSILLFGAAVGMLLLAVVFFTWIKPHSKLQGWANYLRFDDAWGHERGYLWKQLLSYYNNGYSLWEQLFGKGLDCTRFILAEASGKPFTALYYDHAHNEYIQYLVTSGLIGLSTYFLLWGSILIRTIKHTDHPYLWGIGAALLAHGAQAITGLNQPITTPLLLLLLAFGESCLRKEAGT